MTSIKLSCLRCLFLLNNDPAVRQNPGERTDRRKHRRKDGTDDGDGHGYFYDRFPFIILKNDPASVPLFDNLLHFC